MPRKRSILAFSAADVPQFTCRPVFSPRDKRRGSSRERGYDSEWDRLSKRHRAREPLCRECYFRGRKRPWELTNHILPVRDRPDLRLDAKNLSSACKSCHDTIIRELEEVARRMGNIGLMQAWMTDPSSRPVQYRFEARGMPKILRERSDAHRSPTPQ